MKQIPTHGPLSWSVPGCVDGWDQLAVRFGSKPWSELLAPAIAYAEEGFPVSEVIADDWQGAAQALARVPTSAACFLPDGHAPEAGDLFRNPAPREVAPAIAEGGRDAFYRGPLADAMVAYSQQVGGLFSPGRLRGPHQHLGRAGLDELPRLRRLGAPPNGQGIAALQMLNLLEPHDLKALGPELGRDAPPDDRGQEARLRGPRQVLLPTPSSPRSPSPP